MRIRYIQIALIFIFLSCPFAYSQDLIGFWEIKEVKVGEEVMTPVAKWTRINKDGTYESGNGWLQNSIGTWEYDSNENNFTPNSINGIKDEFGAFSVSLSENGMKWNRMEEGMNVILSLERIEKLPMTPADKLQGLWDLTEVVEDGESIMASFDPLNLYYVFIRWDRIYITRTSDNKRSSGYWHIDGHRPHVTFISHDHEKGIESWRIEVWDSELLMTGISDSNKDLMMMFNRLDAFPN